MSRNAEAATTARSVLSSPGVSKSIAYDAKDIIIATAGDGASIADLAGDERLVATRALQRIAIIDPKLFGQMLDSEDMADLRRFDQELVFPFFPAACSGSVSGYVDRVLGKEWAFNPYAADLIARTKCVLSSLAAPVDWDRITATQAYLRRLVTPALADDVLVGGFAQFVEKMAADAEKDPNASTRFGNGLDAAVAFDRAGFGCSPKLVDLVRRFADQPSGLDLAASVSVTSYLAKYCRQGMAIKALAASEIEIDFGPARVAVPLQSLEAETIERLESASPTTVAPPVTYLIAADLRSADKLEVILAAPDLPGTVNLLEGAAAAPEEDVQAAALLWVFDHRRKELIPMVRRLDSLLLDRTILLRISVAAHSDQAIFSALQAYAFSATRSKLSACWTALWGTLDDAIKLVIQPRVEDRKEAFACLSFRSDLPAILNQVASLNHPFYADVLARIKRAILEHDRLSADMKAMPDALRTWRAGIDFTETFGGKLLLIDLVPDLHLRLR